ncbi:NTPase [Thermocrinis sp.]
MKILLTGEPGVGKTTLIKKLLQKLGKRAKGFWTEEIREEKTRKRTGFKIVSTEGQETIFASKYFTSKHLVGSYGVNVSRFESVAIPTLEKAMKEKDAYIVIDEIGKMELFSSRFRELVKEILFNPKYKVIATIPIRDVHPLVKQIRRLPGAVLLEVNKENRDFLAEEIIKLLKANGL